MKEKILTYKGTDTTVTYDLARCIHAAECVHGLPAVFDPKRKPWVDPDQADADAIEAVVHLCPTGALQMADREEAGDADATVRVEADGPLYVRGQLALHDAEGALLRTDTRVALCRCGASKNKPFCDNSHTEAGFTDPAVLGEPKLKDGEGERSLRITLARNGPLLLEGHVSVSGTSEGQQGGIKCALCRCGASNNKPYCDGTHKTIGFVA